MKWALCFSYLLLFFSFSLFSSEITFISILEGLHETRHTRFNGYDGFDWMVRSFPDEQTVIIYIDSTTDYLDVRADISAIISRFFLRSQSGEHRQEQRERRYRAIMSIPDEAERERRLQKHNQNLLRQMASDTFFSLSPQNYILNSQLTQAWRLFLEVLEEPLYQDYRILLVGHSFGALLAQTTAARALFLRYMGFTNRNIYAVTFNAIGANGAVRNYLPTSYLSRYIYTFNRRHDVLTRLAWGGGLGREIYWPEHIRNPEEQGNERVNMYAFLADRLLGNHHLAPIILDLERDLLPGRDCFPWMDESCLPN